MSGISESRSDLIKLLLVACDQAYESDVIPEASILAAFPDSPVPGIPDAYPASLPTRWGYVGLDKWIVYDRFDDAATGFGATLLRKKNLDGGVDYIVAMQGTRGPNIQDWSGNLIYGWDKWSSPTGAEARRLREQLNRLGNVNSIHFTGQSLGGALAEYALYDYATTVQNFDPAKVTLTTFNGLGGVEALTRYRGPIDNALFENVDTAHFYITNDLVSRLGGGHLNGQGNQYLLNFWQTDIATGAVRRRADGSPIALDPFEAHRIESGFYSGFNRASSSQDPEWPRDFTEAIASPIAPLAIGSLAQSGTSLAWLSNEDGALPTDQEAWARAIVAVTHALAYGSKEEIRTLTTAINDSLYVSDLISSRALRTLLDFALVNFLPALAASPSARAAEMAATYLALLAETGGKSDKVDVAPEVDPRALEMLSTMGYAEGAAGFSPLAAGLAMAQMLETDAGKLRSAVLYAKVAAYASVAGLLALPSIGQSAKDAINARLAEAVISLAGDAAAFARAAPLAVGQALADSSVDLIAGALATTVRALVDSAAEVSKSAGALSIDPGEFVSRVRDSASDGLDDVAKTIANGYSDLTLKFADAADWGASVSRSMLAALLDALVSEAIADTGETGADFGEAIGHLEFAAQGVVIRQGRGANPFDQGSVDPDSAPVPFGALPEGSIQTFTVYLPYAAGAGGQRIRLTFDGGGADSLVVLAGGEEAALGGDGAVTLLVPEGRRELSFELLAGQDIDADSNLQLAAQLVDQSGEPTHVEHVELDLALGGEAETAPVTVREIRGDWAPREYVDPVTGRIVYKYDDLGNIERDPGVQNTSYKQQDPLKGSAGPDEVITGDFDTEAYAFSGNDLLLGSEVTGNWLNGGAGDDRLEGGGYTEHGSDYYEFAYLGRVVKLGDDRLYAGASDNQVWGESEASQASLFDSAAGATGLPGDWIDGGTGLDRLYGSAGDDVVLGGAGEDLLVGGAGRDVLLGDDSFQTRPQGNYWRVLHPAFGDFTPGFGGFEVGLFPVISYYPIMSMPDDVNPNSGDPYVAYYGNGGGNDALSGGLGGDILIGQSGDDTLYGGEGDDFLAGWEGDDQLIGGSGDDAMAGDFGRYEQPWQRTVSTPYVVMPGVVGAPAAGGREVDQNGDDLLDGASGNDTLYGEGGNDSVIGGDGDDVLSGDAPYLPEALHGADILDGGAGNDELEGGGGDDQLYGGSGEDDLAGGAGADVLDAGSENDRLRGGDGDDVVRGSDGADFLYGDEGSDRLEGGAGDDDLDGGEGDDLLRGGTGDDRVDGGSGFDTLHGGAGNDDLEGGDGNDLIDGGAGIDTLRGGPGDDVYMLSRGYGRDSIEDAEGASRLRFVSGVSAEDINAELDSTAIVATLAYGGFGDVVVLNLSDFELENVEFPDGTNWTKKNFLAVIPPLARRGTDSAELLAGNPSLRNDLRGLGGHDTLLGSDNDDLLEGGDASDRLDGRSGADRYVFRRDEIGFDSLADSGIDALTYLSGYYARLGIADWADRGEHGGQYCVHDDEGSIDLYFDTYEEAYAAVSYAPIDYIEPLPSIAPLVRRDDAAAISQLVSDGLLTRDLVEFPFGLALADLSLTVTVAGESARTHPAQPWYAGGTLSVRWNNGTAGFDVEVPDVNYDFVGTNLFSEGNGDDPASGAWHGYRLGEGVEIFAFADGTTYSLEEVLARAAVVEREAYVFERGSGQQTINSSWATIEFGADIAPWEVTGARDGTDLVFGLDDGSSEEHIMDWYADPAAVPPMSFSFSDGTVLDTDAATRLGLTQYGSPDSDDLAGDANFASALYGMGGNDDIAGGAGSDLIDSGGGGFLDGGGGDDIYVYARGYGRVEIQDFVYSGGGGLDTLRFGAGIAPRDVAAVDKYGSVTFSIGSEDEVLLDGWMYERGGTIERIQFDDGSVWDAAAIEAMLPHSAATEGDDLLAGTTGDDAIDGLDGNDELLGYAGNDTLTGGAGDDYLEGVAGGDLLYGGEGSDELYAYADGASLLDAGAGDDYVYAEGASFIAGGAGDDLIDAYGEGAVIAFNRGDGNDVIRALAAFTLSIGGDVAPGDLTLLRDGTDLLVDVAGTDSIRLPHESEADQVDWPAITLQMFGSVHEYDFDAVISQYESAAAGEPDFVLPLEGVLQAHEIAINQTDAIGGAIAWRYATAGYEGLSVDDLRTVLAGPGFGLAPQPIALGTSNHPPQAADDTGAAQEDGGPVILSAAALLANDTDSDSGDTKRIVGVTNSTGGAAVRLADDEVIYDPDDLFQELGKGTSAIDGFRYTIADAAGETSEARVTMTISGTNDAPALVGAIGSQTGREGQGFALAVPQGLFNDSDEGDSLVYSAARIDGTPLPEWLEFDPATGVFAGTPGLADGGEYPVRVTVADSSGARAATDLSLTIFDSFAEGERVVGGRGRDVLNGTAAAEVLDGGRGNDLLSGGAGADTYLFERGGGDDVIAESGRAGELDVLRFGAGIRPSMLNVRRRNDDLVLGLKDGRGSVTIKAWFGAEEAHVERIEFAGGNSWNEAQILDHVRSADACVDFPPFHRGHDRHDEEHHSGGHKEQSNFGHGKHDDRVRDVVRAHLARPARFDFDVFLRDSGRGAGKAPRSPGDVRRQWMAVESFAGFLGDYQDDGHGAPEIELFDRAPLAAAGGPHGFGFEASLGASRGPENLRSLEGLREGFARL